MESTLVSKNDPSGIGSNPLWNHLLSVQRRYVVPRAPGEVELMVVITETHGSEKVAVHVEQKERSGAWFPLPGSQGVHESFSYAYRVAWGLWEQLAAPARAQGQA